MLTDKRGIGCYCTCIFIANGFLTIPGMKSKVLYGYIRSAGSSTLPTVIDTIGIWGVRVLFLCYLVSTVLKMDIVWIWWIINADQWVRYLLSLLVFVVKKLINYLSVSPYKVASCSGR